MKHKYLKSLICGVLILLSGVSALMSLLNVVKPVDDESEAVRLGERISSRLSDLDEYGQILLTSRGNGAEWPELNDFPDDFVLYRYELDHISAWYNVFDLTDDDMSKRFYVPCLNPSGKDLVSPLIRLGSGWSYVNYGHSWYLVKAVSKGKVKVVEGLLVKRDLKQPFDKASNGISPGLGARGNSSILELQETDGVPVFVDGTAMFRLYREDEDADLTYVSFTFLWLSLMLALAAVFLYVIFRRGAVRCAVCLSLMLVIAFLGRYLAWRMPDYIPFFSPAVYTDGWLMNTSATLLIFNIILSFMTVCLFLCRGNFARNAGKSVRHYAATLSFFIVFALVSLLYAGRYFVGLIINSDVMLDVVRGTELRAHNLAPLLSFAILLPSLLLSLENIAAILSVRHNLRFHFTSRAGRLLWCGFVSSLVLAVIAVAGFRKEQQRVEAWCHLLAADRNFRVEKELLSLEPMIASDVVFAKLCREKGSEDMILSRLRELYLPEMSRMYDVSIRTGKVSDTWIASFVNSVIRSGEAISPGSRIIYSYDKNTGVRYTGVFTYRNDGEDAVLVADLKMSSGKKAIAEGYDGMMRIPPIYSSARYVSGHMSSFSGNYPYPTMLDEDTQKIYGEKRTFPYNGYRHFVVVDAEGGTIIISRQEFGILVYAVYFTYLFVLFYLIMMPFGRKRRDVLPAHSFQTRIRTLVVVSLSVTLIIMALHNIYYTYRHNSVVMQSTLATKITEVQQNLDVASRSLVRWNQMTTRRFVSKLDDISKSCQMKVVLYSPEGAAIAGWHESPVGEGLMSRMPSDAFKDIMFHFKRYHIAKTRDFRGSVFNMYAPVVNSNGDILAIAGTQYVGSEVRFTKETLMHVAFTLSIFILLLLISVILSSSITASIFRPLLLMSRKMTGRNSEMLETIEYDGRDELYHLVMAYNRMVENLKNSTRELAVAERDKAWSVMSRQVAHEIKNPLTPIKLEIQRLQRLRQKGDPDWEEKFEAASSVILEHIDILSNTADEFSTYAKLYTETPVVVDLDKLISDQVMLFEAGEMKINYIGMEKAFTFGPRPQLIRMFVNLLTNAQQALSGLDPANLPEGWCPEVMVTLRHSHVQGFWEVTVEDNGKGVAPENMDKLFVPNFTTKSGGTGLGLALCQSVVTKCGGSIDYCQSFALGGACFRITLPECAAE